MDWVQSFPWALGNHTGEVTFHVADSRHSGHNTLGSFRYAETRLDARQRVQVARVDDLCASGILERIDFWKLDVEGSELQALQGGAGVLASQRPVVLFECSDGALRSCGSNSVELQAFLEQAGYCFYRFDPDTGRPVPVATPPDEENVIAAPAGWGRTTSRGEPYQF